MSAGALTAQAVLLDAAERRREVGKEAAINADDAGLDLFGELQRPLQVMREDIGRRSRLARDVRIMELVRVGLGFMWVLLRIQGAWNSARRLVD